MVRVYFSVLSFFVIDVLARLYWDSTFYWYSETNFYCNIGLYLGLLCCHSHENSSIRKRNLGPHIKGWKPIKPSRDEIFRTAVYTLFDHKSNEDIFEVIRVEPVDEKVKNTKQILYDK